MDHVVAPEKGEQEAHLLSTVENPLHQDPTTNENSVVEESTTTKESNGRFHETTEWARDIFQLSGGTNKDLIAKQQNIGRTVIVLLFVLGFAAGLINGVILLTNAALCSFQAKLVVIGGYFGIGLLYFLLTMILSVGVACLACRYGAREAAGSGLPEFKYLLASEIKRGDYDRLVSRRIFTFKVIGLIMSVGGGLSVGSEGPLVHTAACIAHLLMKYVIWFDEVLDSPSLTKQIMAASAAVGVSSAFNAPVGGLLFSVEVTSTYYLVANYWKSFIAAMAGSVACNLFLITKAGARSDPLLVLEMKTLPPPGTPQYVKWELAIFVIMGVGFGYLAHFYLALHQRVHVFMRPYNRQWPLATAMTVALITALTVYITGAYTTDSVSVIALVSDVLNKGMVTEMRFWFGNYPMGGLLLMLLCRVALTLLGTNIMVPAGIFMPVHLIGGLLGRFVGYLIYYMNGSNTIPDNTLIQVPGYALVGAVAFASGVTHTISAAVIAVEMSGNLEMILPCLIVAVISAGITKAHGFSVYDQGMMNKGLETFQLLLLERRGDNRRVAATVMDPQVTSMGTRVTVRELITLLQLTAAPSSTTATSTTPTSEFMSAVSASLAVASFMPSSPSSPSSSSSSPVKIKATFAKGGRAAAQTVFPLVDNTTTISSSSSSTSTPSSLRPPRPNLKLVGSVHRRDVFLYLQTLFAQADQRTNTPTQWPGQGPNSGRLSMALQSMLPEDASEEEERSRRADRLALAQEQRDRMLDRVTQSLSFLGQGLGLDAQGDTSETTTVPATTEESAGDSSSSSADLPHSLSLPLVDTTLPPSPPSSPPAAPSPVLKGVLKVPTPPSSPVVRGRGPGSFSRSNSGRLTAGVDSLVVMLFGPGSGSGSSLPPSPESRLRSTSSPSSSPPSSSPQGSPKTHRHVTFVASSPDAVVSDEICTNADCQQQQQEQELDQQQQEQAAAHENRLSSLLSVVVDIDLDAAAAAAFNVNRFPFSVTEQTPMEHVYILFEMVRAPAIFVVHDGGLRGMISRERLLDSLRETDAR